MSIRTLFLIAVILCSTPVWAQKIVYSQLTGDYWQIWSMDVTSKKAVQLTKTPVDKREPRCNADGSRLLYRTANAELFLLNIKNAGNPPEQKLATLGVIMDQRWSGDGKILFTRMRSDLMDDSDVWLSDLNGANLREVTRVPLLQYHARFFGNKQVLYVSQDPKTEGHNLWLKDLEGNQARPLTQGKFYDLLPDISPDRKSVVFSSNRSGSFDIWKMDMASLELKRLTDQATLETYPSFSSDGKLILYISSESGSKQIWLMSADGGNQVQVSDDRVQRQEASWCGGNI